MSKHTPLPWNPEAINRLLRFGRKNSGSWDDVDIWPEDDSMNMPYEDDTNLIAAAPELLESLEEVLSFVAFIEDPVVLKARAAIEKATGK